MSKIQFISALKKFFAIPLLFMFGLSVNLSGQEISGTVNDYYQITDVYATYVMAGAGEDLTTLQPGDKVILMQMTGVLVNNGPGFESGDWFYDDFADAGRYEMLAVKSVNNATKRIEFSVDLDVSKFTSGEKFQLVRIYEANNARVTGTLTSDPWDGAKGGIVALVIYKKLELEADIDVSGKGFRGADTEPNYSAGCISGGLYHYPTGTTNVAGRKGEGNIENGWTHMVGPGKVVTGGGGGLGYFAGGGGGGHFGRGGLGGNQGSPCGVDLFASGGLFLTRSNNFYGNDRVTMGGGGGSSTEDATYSATPGGDGGGIVIILADTLVANGHAIYSRGETISVIADAGGGGGGAGGSILLDINYYEDDLNLDVSGGDGGSTDSLATGAGGGGGGGLIWHAGSPMPVGYNISLTGGNQGLPAAGPPTLYGGDGESGGIVDSLELPLHGFLFNSINGVDTICEGQQPDLLTASMPKGGTAAYIYTWLQSTDNNTWSVASGSGDSLNFQPDPLTETTYFTRVVNSDDVYDTALSVKVFVYDAINGNTIANRDTLCFGQSPGLLTGGTLTGGDGVFGYQWQSSTNGATWTNRSTAPAFTEGALNQTTLYRRITTSVEVCSDTSNLDTLTILPLITNNTYLSADTAICENLNGGIIRTSVPEGGDGNYRYQWMISDDNSSFTDIPGATQRNLMKGVLTESKYYVRIVLSGSDDVCIDTINTSHLTTVYPSLTNNTISTDSSRYCFADIPFTLEGENPAGGDAGSYFYNWVRSADNVSWQVIEGETAPSYTPSTEFLDTTFVRRIVYSGDFNACVDSSSSQRIDVIPELNNVLTSPDESICEESVPAPFAEDEASGGAGGYNYLWQSRNEGEELWTPASEEIVSNSLESYSSPALVNTTHYRRVVYSQICESISEPIPITVFPFIENNTISGGDLQYTCYNSAKSLTGSVPTGGDPDVSSRVYIWQQSADTITWTNAEGNFSGQNYVSEELLDSLYFRRVVTSGPTAQCKDTTQAVLVRINPLPTGDILSDTDTLCAGDEITIEYFGLTGSSPWEIDLGEGSSLHTESGISDENGNIIFNLFNTANIEVLVLSDANGCIADPSGLTGTVSATVFEVPLANAGEDFEQCELETTLEATPSVGEGVWSAQGSASIDEPFTAQTDVRSEAYGPNAFLWTETNWKCQSSDEVTVTFYETPTTADAGADQLLDNFYTTTISGNIPAVGEGKWSFVLGSGTFIDSTQATTEVTLDGPGDYTLTWTIENGVCPVSSDELLLSIGELKQYTGFSPNGDGVNDVFTLRFPGTKQVELIVFDKWGSIVHQQIEDDAVELSWDGTYQKNGNIVAEGTYYYIVKENGATTTKNYIELRR